MRDQTREQLRRLQQVMEKLDLWQSFPPDETAFLSTQPFALDTMEADEWLQWIFIPRMYALLEGDLPLPNEIAVVPYIEEALKELDGLQELLDPISEIERLCKAG
ncbi:YqcC family protein [Caviibacterium pharyngocola]|uniref:Anhydro-N-acetylmuramic acid kinase n=1 Tax=Caviibacterium pharyngocola TaxID=28159 RepID=A0A2M8RUX1_9PAST|nr:YqcC family protein [Caviibacterium pharyngocola]PJG82675.1 anhydro-N-acetylmuramic acid kinase [Caviibacterium pharyngocola]